jgi:hypothetical protein
VRNASGFPAPDYFIFEGCAFDILSRRSLDRKRGHASERQSHSAQQSGRAASGLPLRQ